MPITLQEIWQTIADLVVENQALKAEVAKLKEPKPKPEKKAKQ